jgi:hypothetical protein
VSSGSKRKGVPEDARRFSNDWKTLRSLRFANVNAATLLVEFNGAVFEGEEGEVSALSTIFAGDEFVANLTYDDAPCGDGLSTEAFNTTTLSITVASVA